MNRKLGLTIVYVCIHGICHILANQVGHHRTKHAVPASRPKLAMHLCVTTHVIPENLTRDLNEVIAESHNVTY